MAGLARWGFAGLGLLALGCGGDNFTTTTGAGASGGSGGTGGSGGGVAGAQETGGSSTGGGSTGGSSTGGGSTGGSSTGGSSTGGSSTGGSSTGGSSTGGSATGGTGGEPLGGTGGVTGGTGGVTGGTGGTGGNTGGTGGGNTGGTGGGNTGGTGGVVACAVNCAVGIDCCDNVCVNLQNDPVNCGACGVQCSDNQPVCSDGHCVEQPCSGVTCTEGSCCGEECCSGDQLCCYVQVGGPVALLPSCYNPVEGTCPQGCPSCDCAAPNTPVATPDGFRPIAELEPGDLVYSIEGDGVVTVPIAQVVQRPAQGHVVPEIRLESGEVLQISARHPTADGRGLGEVRAGDMLGEARVVSVHLVAYPFDHTYDILPATSTGYYFVGEALIGSTLGGAAAICE